MSRRSNRTRIFEGEFNGHRVRVKVNPRLVSIVLTVTLVTTAAAGVIKSNNSLAVDPAKTSITMQDETITVDKEAIENIIRDNPNLLYIETPGIHEVHFGESLSTIAEDYGITIDRLKALNEIDDSKYILQAEVNGHPNELRIVNRESLVGSKVAEVLMLQSYLEDYVLHGSVAAQIAHDTTGEYPEEQINFYNSLLFKNDGYSLQDQYLTQYFLRIYDETISGREAQRNRILSLSDEQLDKYINILESLVETLSSLKAGCPSLVDYNQYKIYYLNGNTKSDTLVQKNHTIYG